MTTSSSRGRAGRRQEEEQQSAAAGRGDRLAMVCEQLLVVTPREAAQRGNVQHYLHNVGDLSVEGPHNKWQGARGKLAGGRGQFDVKMTPSDSLGRGPGESSPERLQAQGSETE